MESFQEWIEAPHRQIQINKFGHSESLVWEAWQYQQTKINKVEEENKKLRGKVLLLIDKIKTNVV